MRSFLRYFPKFFFTAKIFLSGYLIKKSAARAFLKQLEQEKPFWLADDFLLFETQFQINNKVVRPLIAIENPQLVSNLEAIRGSKSNNWVKKLMKYPLKKILAVKKNLGKSRKK